MRSLAISTLTLLCAVTAAAQSQFRVEYKLYRTSVPDEERAAKEQTVRSSPQFGIIEGDYINEDAGFSLDGKQLVYTPADSDKELRYELISSPSLAVVEDEEATIQIGEQVPYQDIKKGEDGKPIAVTKHKNVGTTVKAIISESSDDSDDNVFIRTNGEFVTLVGRKKWAVVDQDGNASVVPILETTTWESEMTLPLGAWLYQRVKVTQGHEFLIFARVTRFDAEAEAKHEQYSVEMKLVRVPEPVAERVREQFVYDDGVESVGDEARVFRVLQPGTGKTAAISEFLSIVRDDGVELVTAPRVTVGNGSSLFKIVVYNNPLAREVPGSTPDNVVISGIEQLLELSPVAAQFLGDKGSNLGVISDATFYQDPASGSAQGFEGYQFWVQIDPRANAIDNTFGLNLGFHNQFKTGGREKTFFRKAEPYTFGDQIFSFSGLPVIDNEWFGIDFTSKKTGDPMFLIVEVDTIYPSGTRTIEAAAKTPPVSTNDKSLPKQDSFSSFAIPEDVEVILDIVPQIDGHNVRLHTELIAVRDAPARSLLWADVVVPNREAAVIGYDIDSAEMRAHLLGIGSKSGMGSPVSGDGTANVFQGVAVPDDVDYVAGITPQIDGGNIRVWLNFARKEDLGKPAAELDVWTNVIVRAGDALTLGHYVDGRAELLGIRRAATFDK